MVGMRRAPIKRFLCAPSSMHVIPRMVATVKSKSPRNPEKIITIAVRAAKTKRETFL